MKKLLLLFVWFPFFSFGQTINLENVITVIGISDKEIEPDWIELGMTAKETENIKKESETVIMENSILKFILSLGMDSGCFSVDRYSADTKYRYSSGSKVNLNKAYLLKVNNVKLLDTVIAKCFESGMDNLYVNQVGHSKIDSFQNILLQDALISAKLKALLIAKTMDVSLGKVISENETFYLGNNQPGLHQFNDYRLEEVTVNAYGIQNKARVGSSISFQKLKLAKTVIVKYEIK
ncbi:MAG: SIMPL domain-containing protein [Bacteroidales bacterium]|nr:SIMPL domain-containing protein [Bacteroidales bacterium]